MHAYAPSDPQTVWVIAAAFACTLLLSFAVGRIPSPRIGRAAAWLLVIGSVVLADRMTDAEPPGLRMLAIITLLFFAMKAVVSVEAKGRNLSRLRWLAFAAAWPGMHPSSFESLGERRRAGGARLMEFGTARLFAAGIAWWAVGSILTAAASGLWIMTGSHLLATVLLLPGLSLVFHFGLFNLVAGGWRLLGANTYPLFRAPLLSRSLTEFWGRRWNLAFSEMTAVAVYRPVAAVAGKGAGLFASFLLSGMLHEVAISLPVRAGYGLPFAYFVLHGALALVERELERRGRPISRSAALGRTWTIFWLVAPLPILFHPPFLRGVIWPLIGAS